MTSETILYDQPGPRTRRRIRIGTIVAGVGIAVLLFFVIKRLVDRDQFSMEKWGPLIDPGNEDFASVWRVIGEGLGNTVQAAILAMLLSVVIGTTIAIGRLSLGKLGRIPLVGLVEFLRGVPVVVTIYFTSRVLPDFVETSGWIGGEQLWFLVIGLTLYNSVIFAEIVRAGVLSLPSGQREASLAMGMTNAQTMRSVLLPQAFRAMLPAIISQLVVVLKDTSLIAVVGNYEELVGAGERLYIILRNPIQMFTVIAIIYIAINYSLSRLAQVLERRLSGSSRSAAVEVELETTTTGA